MFLGLIKCMILDNFHTFIYLIELTFRTFTLYPRKKIKNRTFKFLINKGSELIRGIKGKGCEVL